MHWGKLTGKDMRWAKAFKLFPIWSHTGHSSYLATKYRNRCRMYWSKEAHESLDLRLLLRAGHIGTSCYITSHSDGNLSLTLKPGAHH